VIFNTILDTIFSKRLSEKEAFFIFELLTEIKNTYSIKKCNKSLKNLFGVFFYNEELRIIEIHWKNAEKQYLQEETFKTYLLELV